ncbi:MAG TPA: C40 family peptidase [Gaiellaceae bacterium]|jgi:cell wall-associated NlpC family hydrolase
MRGALVLCVAITVALTSGVAWAGTATVGVSVATLWKAPGIARPLDAPALASPADPAAWSRNLATTDLRLWLDSHVQTQALYGEPVAVLARRGSWVKIAVTDQPDPQNAHGYPGWVPARQLVFRPPAGSAVAVIVTAPTVWLTGGSGRRHVQLSFATRLPLVREQGASVVVRTATGGTGRLPRSAVRVVDAPLRPSGAQIVATIKRFLGVHYLWGGLSAWGFDCSGIIWSAYRSFGVTIPRDADPQFRAARPVSTSTLRPGDLLFYGTRSYVHHDAVYAGGGKMLEAPDSAHRVRLVPMRWGELVGAGRF